MAADRDEQGLESKFENGVLYVTIDKAILENSEAELIELLRSRFDDDKLDRIVLFPRKD